MALSTRSRFLTRFRAQHSLRFHMFLILLATAVSGALVSKLLLVMGVEGFTIRYPVAVLLSYAMFFGCIKLWLLAIAPSSGSDARFIDAIDVPVGGTGGPACGSSGAPFSGGGGSFAGGGASGDFDADSVPLTSVAVTDAMDNAGSALHDAAGSAMGDAVGEAAGEAAGEAIGGVGDALGDEGGLGVIIVALVLVVVLAAILGASVYVIYEAPVILSEAAFQGVLAATLTRRTRTMAQGEWMGSVLRATWKPFVITLGVTMLCALLLQGFFPGASRLADIWR